MAQIKICGIKRLEDIDVLNEYKPEYIGFVFAKSKRQVSHNTARELRDKLCPTIKTVGVFVNHDINEITTLLNQGIIDIAQLHGNEDENYIFMLKNQTNKTIIKAIPVSSIDDILTWENSSADYLLFDNGAGGTGKVFSWDILKDLNENYNFKKPFFIAGGLNIDNVATALEFTPFGVDVSSGVESDNIKDKQKIIAFIKKIRETNNI